MIGPADLSPTPAAQRKVVRWGSLQDTAIFDHKCENLPAGMRFYKFHLTITPEERDAFSSKGRFEREVVCPYCGRHIVYVVTNIWFAAQRRVIPV